MPVEGCPDVAIYSPEEKVEPLNLSKEDKDTIRAITLGIEEVAPEIREMAVEDVIHTLENGHPLNKIISGKEGEVVGYLAFEDFLPHEAYIKYLGTTGLAGRSLLREIPAFLEFAKQQGYTKLNFHGWNQRLNHIMERYGFKRLRTDNMGEFSVDFYEKSLIEEKSPEELSVERAKAFEQKYLAKIQKDYEQTLKTFSEENRPKKEKIINEVYHVVANRLQNTDGFEFGDRAKAILKLKLARYFQDNETIDQNTLCDAIIETPKFLQSDKGSLFRLFEVHEQKTLQRIAEIRKKRAEMNGDEEYNPYEALFTTKSGKYYVARLLNMPHLEEESGYMDHCVGTSDSYINRMKKGEVEILSFRHIPEWNPDTHQFEIDMPIITIEYNRNTKTIGQMKKHGDQFLKPSDPFFDDVVDALKKLRLTETDTGELRNFCKISESELKAISVSDFHVLTENGEVNFRDFDPEGGEFILKIGSMPIDSETSKDDAVKIIRIVEGIKVEEDQIAQTQEELSEKTKIFFGQLPPHIFQKYPNLENVYTSFPEGKISRGERQTTGRTGIELKTALENTGVSFTKNSTFMILSPEFVVSPAGEKITTIRLKVRDLFPDGKSYNYDQIVARASELGLDLLPHEIAPDLLLDEKNQPNSGEWYSVATKTISGRDGSPLVFSMERDDDGLWLLNSWTEPDYECCADHVLVFRLRNVSQTA